MLSGIKIIPRDKVNSTSKKEVSDSDYSPGKRKKSKSKKKKHDKKRNKRKSSYGSDDDDSITSQSTSEGYSESEEELNRKIKSNKKRGSLSYDEDALSSDEDDWHEGKKKKRAKGKKKAVKGTPFVRYSSYVSITMLIFKISNRSSYPFFLQRRLGRRPTEIKNF